MSLFGTKSTAETTPDEKRKDIVDAVMKREAADSIIEGYETEIAQSREVANRSKREAEIATEKAAEAKAEEEREAKRLAATQDQHKSVQVSLVELTTKRDTILSEVTIEDKKLKDLRTAREAEAVKLTEVQTYLADLQQAQADETAKFNSECNQYRAKTAELLAEMEKAETDLKLTVNRSATRIAKLDEEIVNQVSVNEGLIAKQTHIEEAITKLEERQAALTTAVEVLQTSITTLKTEKEEAEKSKKEALDALAITETKLTEMQAEVKKIEEAKFALADRTRALDEREALIQEHFIRAGVPYPKK